MARKQIRVVKSITAELSGQKTLCNVLTAQSFPNDIARSETDLKKTTPLEPQASW